MKGPVHFGSRAPSAGHCSGRKQTGKQPERCPRMAPEQSVPPRTPGSSMQPRPGCSPCLAVLQHAQDFMPHPKHCSCLGQAPFHMTWVPNSPKPLCKGSGGPFWTTSPPCKPFWTQLRTRRCQPLPRSAGTRETWEGFNWPGAGPRERRTCSQVAYPQSRVLRSHPGRGQRAPLRPVACPCAGAR